MDDIEINAMFCRVITSTSGWVNIQAAVPEL